MNKHKFVAGNDNYAVPFCAISSMGGVFYDNDKLSLVGKILDKFISGYGEFSVDYRDVLAGVGIEDDECILMGMPVFYEKKNAVTYDNIDMACSNELMNNYDSIINSFCETKHLLETEDDLNLVSSIEWNFNPYFVGLVEFKFYVSGFSEFLFKLFIDVQSGIVLLCDDKAISVYEINKDVSIGKDKVIIKKCSYGGVVNRPNKIYMQWLEYNSDNPDNLLSFETYCEKFVKKPNVLVKLLSGKLGS